MSYVNFLCMKLDICDLLCRMGVYNRTLYEHEKGVSQYLNTCAAKGDNILFVKPGEAGSGNLPTFHQGILHSFCQEAQTLLLLVGETPVEVQAAQVRGMPFVPDLS